MFPLFILSLLKSIFANTIKRTNIVLQRKSTSLRYILLLILFYSLSVYTIEAKKKHHVTDKDDYTSLYFFNPDKKGFEISASGVFMFTTGAKDRKGFRWGAGLSASQDIGDFKLTAGFDTYKAKEKFGIGTSFAGISYNNGKYGGSYYLNKYYQGDKQVSGILGVQLDDFEIRFEDDILSLPFTGFKVYDRYRTAALEVRYRHFLIGTNVYTNEVNGLTDVSSKNKKGAYYNSEQISSPIYVGYTNKNLIFRYGINSHLGGFWGQNWWHQNIFDSTDFKYGNFSNPFMQIGIDKPYTLY